MKQANESTPYISSILLHVVRLANLPCPFFWGGDYLDWVRVVDKDHADEHAARRTGLEQDTTTTDLEHLQHDAIQSKAHESKALRGVAKCYNGEKAEFTCGEVANSYARGARRTPSTWTTVT